MSKLSVTLSMTALLSPVATLAAQGPPTVTDVRHVQWSWKAKVELPAPGHVVVVDWHPELGIERRYPRAGTDARRLDAGRHTLAGELRDGESRVWRGRYALSGRSYRLIPFMDRPEWPISYASPALAAMRMPPAAGTRPRPDDVTWQAFVLSLPAAVSAAEVDSVILEVDLTGDAHAELAAFAAALGATSWGGQAPHVRRRSRF